MIEITMLVTKKGQEKDQQVKTYEKGKVYQVVDDSLAEVFVSMGWATMGAEIPDEMPVVETAEELRRMKAKDLKQIIRKYTLDIDTQNVSAAELSERIIKKLALKD